MVPEEIVSSLNSYFRTRGDHSFTVYSAQKLTGGDINQVYRLHTTSGLFCLKYNVAGKYPEMFRKEALGLELLQNAGELRIPGVEYAGTSNQYAYLLLEYIDSARQVSDFMARFGISLAKLHDHTAGRFGLDHDNYMGSLAQSNIPADNWVEFFSGQRLLKQVSLAFDSGRIDRNAVADFDRFYARLDQLLVPGKPSLLHGDLWGGNYMVSETGEACLIDPAAYFGHREVDLAMTTLFGGFSPDFYRGYESHHKLEAGWRERLDIYNLYPLLVHLNLFGSSYLGSVMNILKRFL